MAAVIDNITPIRSWGAHTDDWTHFDLVLGLTEDLMPVVSNTRAVVSPSSSLSQVGKVPSVYNHAGQVVGLSSWTSRQTTAGEIVKWSRQPDYGICLQTRRVRAIDIDDSEQGASIRQRVVEVLGFALPARSRANSGKVLLPFTYTPADGERFPKRIVKTASGAIEILGDGQQFIAVGTHPSGVRYDWGALPNEIPDLTEQQFLAVFDMLVAEFAVEPAVVVGAGTALRAPRIGLVRDNVVDYLDEHDLILGVSTDGKVFIDCIGADEHTTDSGITATMYVPAGTGGFEQGHFKCLHAHCARRTDGDFLRGLGIMADDYAVVVAPPGDVLPPLPNFERDNHGRILATIGNLVKATSNFQLSGWHLASDTFRAEIMITTNPGKSDGWRGLTDADCVALRVRLEEHGFKPIGKEITRDAITLTADQHQFDSAILWLDGLAWDGVPRIETFLRDYFGTLDTPYTRAVSLYWWTAMAGRVLDPGCQADMVPVLISAQGLGKSTGVAAVAPAPEFFCEVNMADHDDDTARNLRGVLLAEMAELKGLNSKEEESIKAFITRRHDKWVQKYKEYSCTYRRRCVFVGTSNKTEFLVDETGHRRWLPVNVTQGDPLRIAADRAQLWAEARLLFIVEGVAWADAERLARDVHAAHTVTDPWEPAVYEWLQADDVGEMPDMAPFKRGDGPFRLADVLAGALNIPTGQIDIKRDWRMGRVLTNLKYEKRDRWHDGRNSKWWYRKTAPVKAA